MLQLQDGYPIAPHVMALEGGFALFTHELIFGGQGRAPFSRFDSADGLTFAQQRDFEGTSFLGFPEDVLVVDDRWFWFYRTPEDLEMRGAGARNAIAWLTSDDGQVWQAGGRYEGSGRDEDAELMTTPRVVHDGRRFHLYYTGWNKVSYGDVGSFVYSVGHATSDDGDGFAFESVLFAAEPCEVSSHSTWTVVDVLSSPCLADCPIDGVHLLMRHRACPADATSTADGGFYVASSTDGARFSTPVRVPDLTFSDTVMVDGQRLISWASDADALSVRVNVQPLPPALAHVCGEPTAP